MERFVQDQGKWNQIRVICVILLFFGGAVFAGLSIARGSGEEVFLLLGGMLFVALCMVLPISHLVGLLFLCILLASARQYGHWIFVFKKMRWVPILTLAVRGILPALLHKKVTEGGKWHPVHLLWLVFLGYIVVFSFRSIDPFLSLARAIAYTAIYVGIFFSVWHFLDDIGKIDTFLRMIRRLCVWIILLGIPAYLWNPHFATKGGRLRGIVGNPNALGLLCGITILLLFYEILSRRRRGDWGRGLLIGVIGICLFFTGSRGGGMVALIGILLLLLLSGARRALPYFFLLAFMAFSFFVASYEGLRLPKVRQDDVSLESTLKVSERQEAWHAAWALIRKRPFLGYGFGTGDEIFAYFKISFKHHQGAYVHNSYLQFWLETGIIGLMIMLGILLLFAREGLRNLRRASEERTRMIAGLLFAFFAASCIHASIESWMISPGSVHTAIFWLMASAMLKIGQSIEGEEAVSA